MSVLVCDCVRPLVELAIQSALKAPGVLTCPGSLPGTTCGCERAIPISGYVAAIQAAKSTHHLKQQAHCPCSEGLPVILLSEGWIETEKAVLAAGIKGYLGPETGPEQIREAITAVADGGFYYRPGKIKGCPMEVLTDRQVAVISLVGQGYSDKEIAERMGLSEATVRHHMDLVMNKANVTRRMQIGTLAALGGLFNPDTEESLPERVSGRPRNEARGAAESESPLRIAYG